MLLSTLLTSSLLCLLPLSDARPQPHRARVDRPALRRSNSAVQARNATVEKRAFNGMRATFYDVGLGACGWNNVASDYIVAQNSAQYGGGYPGPNCGKSITISYNGNTATATIADECPSCPYGGLDFSRGLFDHFASEDLGVIYVDWWYNDGSDSGGGGGGNSGGNQPQSSSTTEQQTPSSTAAPTTTQAPASSSATASSTITSAASSASSGSASSGHLLGVSTNGTVLPAIATMSTNGTTVEVQAGSLEVGNLLVFNQVVARLGHIIVVGAEIS